MKQAINTNSRTKGTQVVELALVLPLLLFLSLAVSEGAYMIRAHQVLNNAAREGARLAILQYDSPASLNNNAAISPQPGPGPQYITNCGNNANPSNPICAAVLAYANDNGLVAGSGFNRCNGGLQVTVQQNYPIPNNGVTMSGSLVQVVCPYTLSFLPRVPGFGAPGQVNLRSAVVFGNFYQP